MFIFQWINKQKEETDKISFKPIHRGERWSIDRFFFSLFVCKNQSRTMIFFWQRGRGALFRNNCTEWFIDTRWKTRQRKSVGIYHSDLMLFSFRPTWFRCIEMIQVPRWIFYLAKDRIMDLADFIDSIFAITMDGKKLPTLVKNELKPGKVHKVRKWQFRWKMKVRLISRGNVSGFR